MTAVVHAQREENPDCEDAAVDVAYFDGDPTAADLKDAGGGRDGFTVPFRSDTPVSVRAGLQRWILSQSV